MSSNRREKFIELAESRVNRALQDVRLIGNLSNKSNYEYTDRDATKIIKALEEGVADLKRRFRSPSGSGVAAFKLDDQ